MANYKDRWDFRTNDGTHKIDIDIGAGTQGIGVSVTKFQMRGDVEGAVWGVSWAFREENRENLDHLITSLVEARQAMGWERMAETATYPRPMFGPTQTVRYLGDAAALVPGGHYPLKGSIARVREVVYTPSGIVYELEIKLGKDGRTWFERIKNVPAEDVGAIDE